MIVYTNILLVSLALSAGSVIWILGGGTNMPSHRATAGSTAVMTAPTPALSLMAEPILVWPISEADKRISKKPFGLKVSPQNSPVNPERFNGYHTGTDFEVFSNEATSSVPVYAICSGKASYRNYVSGYGGVVIQECRISDQSVTVLYGHLKLSSITTLPGKKIITGSKIGILGQGYSSETDGERKHLHLGIHLGSKINLRGYVASVDDLKAWLDPLQVLGIKH